ncbi:MAG TPA: YraN family protein [Ignavibacteria bacterium]|nr:YraN family protein [Ignavibacteria bacterium]HMR38997.1 YraN family protein [Ignavibacteria bacterium]
MKCIYKNRLGANGELIAKKYLADKNYRFIKNNYRYERAEVDLIFEDVKNKILIFAEVKTRRNKNFGKPEDAINFTKQEHIKKAAMGFVSENEKFSDHDLRIDVISILLKDGKAEIEHFENAF